MKILNFALHENNHLPIPKFNVENQLTDFTDHTFRIDYDERLGWYYPRIIYGHEIKVHLMIKQFHYPQGAFEGMKAFYRPDGFALFRPELNAERFKSSLKNQKIPYLKPDDLVKAITALVREDYGWMPKNFGEAIYIRPSIIATDASLSPSLSKKFLLFVSLSRMGSFFGPAQTAKKIKIFQKYARTVQGMIGACKAHQNYSGASIVACEEAKDDGYDQVVFLDGVESKWLEEAAVANIFFVSRDNELITPALDKGTILPGITRRSILEMAEDLGLQPSETDIEVEDMIKNFDSGYYTEMFMCGTAAVVSPIGALCYYRKDGTGVHIPINKGLSGPVSNSIYKRLTDIQYGRIEDPYSWMRFVHK